VAQKAKDRGLAHLHLFLRQASFKLGQRAIRLFCYERLYQICMGCKGKCLVAAKFGWADTAGFPLSPDEPANRAQSQVVQLGYFLAGKAGFDVCNDTFAQIVGVWFRHSPLAPLAPVVILNLIRAPMGIPNADSTFPANALASQI
jgi:hypothetical protein